MSKYRVPLEKPKPDIERFIKIMEGKIKRPIWLMIWRYFSICNFSGSL